MHRNVPLQGKKFQAFSGGAPQTQPGYPPQTPHFPQSPQCLDQCRAFDAFDASNPSNFFPISTISIYAYKRAKDVLGRTDCRLSE